MEIVIAMYIRFIDLADLVFSTKFDEIPFIELSSRGAQCLSSRCFRFQILPTSFHPRNPHPIPPLTLQLFLHLPLILHFLKSRFPLLLKARCQSFSFLSNSAFGSQLKVFHFWQHHWRNWGCRKGLVFLAEDFPQVLSWT